AIKKQKPPTWRGFVSNLGPAHAGLFVCPALSSTNLAARHRTPPRRGHARAANARAGGRPPNLW
ncbi:hypothetical protein, partial [Burkholderia pseudomallei]|uniref:hypothetical protein n=1 Tax=Burkholderia pseudomallei TaxID=28450 RepID=UPI001C4AD3EB